MRVGTSTIHRTSRVPSGLGLGSAREALVYAEACLLACVLSTVRHDRAFSLPQELFLKLAARGGGHALASLYISARELELACTARPRHSVTTLPPRAALWTKPSALNPQPRTRLPHEHYTPPRVALTALSAPSLLWPIPRTR